MEIGLWCNHPYKVVAVLLPENKIQTIYYAISIEISCKISSRKIVAVVFPVVVIQSINYAILIVWFSVFVFAHDWLYRMHSRWF